MRRIVSVDRAGCAAVKPGRAQRCQRHYPKARQPADRQREDVLAIKRRASRERLKADPRLDLPERPAVLDSPAAHAFSLGDDEFLVGTPRTVAEEIIAQCRRTGAGNFAALFDRTTPPEQLQSWYRDFGAHVIPLLRSARV